MQRDFSGGKPRGAGGYGGGKKFGGGGGYGGGSRFGGGSKFGGHGGGGGSRFGEDRQMFPATCGDCGSDCEVPFRPNGSRPVLCRNCFKKDDAGGGRFERPAPRSGGFGFGGDRPAPRAGGNDDGMKAVNMKLDKILALLNEIIGADEDGEEEAEGDANVFETEV